MSPTRRLRLPAVLVVTGLALSGCSVPWGSDPVGDFIEAFNAGDDATAATLVDDPDLAAEDLSALRGNIGETRVELEEGGEDDEDENSTTITATWTVPSGDTVESTGQAVISEQDSELLDWSKQIFSTEFTEDSTITYSDDRDFTVPVKDRNGTDVLAWTPVTVITAGPGLAAQAEEIAEAVRPVIPEADEESISETIDGVEGEPVSLFTLREEDFEEVRSALESIEGLEFREQGQLLGPTRDTASPLDGGLREYWTDQITADGGWTLQASSPTGETVLGQEQPAETEPIMTTLDLGLQSAAQNALGSIEEPASIVAMSASTGGVLGVAQNEAADEQGPISLTGLYPPGSTFKTVTTAAALERGTVTPDEQVACPASAEIDGRVIPNDSDFELGEVSMTQAFAQSCNTTQGFISQELEPADMKNAGLSLGLGVDFSTPGMTSVTGSVPETEPGAARVEAAIGQGEVLASPFGLATMEASLGNNGEMVLPTLIQGEETEADQQPEPLDPQVVDDLRAMMTETVSSGTASSLSDIEGLGGKTGTAETGGGASHGWFVGIKGDLAFAVFVEGAGSSGPAVEAAGRFLRDDTMAEWR